MASLNVRVGWIPMTSALDDLLDQLSVPLTADEEREGCTAEAKAGIAGYVRSRRAQLAVGPLFRDYGLVRGLDAWGVGGGELYNALMDLNRELPEPGEKAVR